MGNGLPSSNFGHIYLRTQNPFYYAGETVSGEVFLNLLEEYPGTTIYLKLKGTEECHFEEQVTHFKENPDGTRTSVTETRHHKGHNSFYRHKFPIYVWQGDYIPRGQWCFPFSLALNQQLPGTFGEKEVHFQAKIKYKAKVELQALRKDVKPLKFTQELVVREPIKNQMLYNIPVENSVSAKTWCCIDQGVSKMKCFFEKNTYCPGELANMVCEVDNSLCNLPVRAVNMRLLMNIRLCAHHGKEKFIQETVNSYDLPGVIGARESAVGDNRKIAGILLTNQMRHRALQPSTTGSIVKCEYVLAVKTVLEGVTCCAADPEVRIPLTIFAAPPVNFNQIQAPQDWQPQVMPVYNCVFAEGFAYPSEKQALGDNYQQQMNFNQVPGGF